MQVKLTESLFMVDLENPQDSFNKIANQLLNHFLLQVNNKFYRLLEIEFYVNDKIGNGLHIDDYTHGHEIQKKSNKFYFHGSGMDIAIGNEKMFGGILIRAIAEYNKGLVKENIVFGPLKVVTEIFNNFNNVIEGDKNTFNIVPSTLENQDVFALPRIGLNENKNKEFHSKPYRFIIHPELGHKDKTAMAIYFKENYRMGSEEINKLLGSKFI
jgi:3-methyladenine DNA glycosylase Mpg